METRTSRHKAFSAQDDGEVERSTQVSAHKTQPAVHMKERDVSKAAYFKAARTIIGSSMQKDGGFLGFWA